MNLCDYCNQPDELTDYHDHLFEHRTVRLCPDCHDMACDHADQLLFDDIADDEFIREPEASYL